MTRFFYPLTISFLDFPCNESWATLCFFAGCEHACKGCHSPQLQMFDAPTSIQFDKDLFEFELARLHTKNLVLTGGDPLYCLNIPTTKWILETYGSCINICIYTGYNINYVREQKIEKFKFVKCGTFEQDLFLGSTKTDQFMQFSSSNQILYNSSYFQISENGRYYF